jgi:hypothetical protein
MGNVIDAKTEKPITGATVHYRGAGGMFVNNVESNPPSIEGEVVSAADGSYALPLLPPGNYSVRAAAPGYFGARIIPLSSSAVTRDSLRHMARDATRNMPAAHPAVQPHYGELRMTPDSLFLQGMAADALKKFERPTVPNAFTARQLVDSSFSKDGASFHFASTDRAAVIGKDLKESCHEWQYEFASGTLQETPLEMAVCRKLVQEHGPPVMQGRYSFRDDDVELGHGSTQVTLQYAVSVKNTPTWRSIATGYTHFSFLVSADSGFAVYAANGGGQSINGFLPLGFFDVVQRRRSTYVVPAKEDQNIEFRNALAMPDGSVRVAYTIEGAACDWTTKDIAAPDEHEQSRNELDRLQVCFVTIPASAREPVKRIAIVPQEKK